MSIFRALTKSSVTFYVQELQSLVISNDFHYPNKWTRVKK